MSDFDSFLSSLSDEQKQKLMEALIPKADNTKPKKESIKKEHKQSKPVANVSDDFIVNKDIQNSRRREAVRARKNEWTDNGEHRDIVTPEFEKTPRNRQAPKKVDLECDVCGRSFKEDSRFVYGERHRCSRCTGK